jgi:hypothetical protein
MSSAGGGAAHGRRQEGLVAGARAFVATWRGRAIALFLLVQLGLPATYYLRRDRHDERFSWRMFSPMRMARCQPEATVAGQQLALGGTFHEAWIELAKRGRRSVLEAMGQRLCRDHAGKEVVLWLRCEYLDGSRRQYGGFDICKVPEL